MKLTVLTAVYYSKTASVCSIRNILFLIFLLQFPHLSLINRACLCFHLVLFSGATKGNLDFSDIYGLVRVQINGHLLDRTGYIDDIEVIVQGP